MHELKNIEKERALLIGLTLTSKGRWETEEHLEELALLADTAGAEVFEKCIQEKEKIDPAFYIGRGKAEWIADRAKDNDVDLLIFDDDLSPAQVRNLEKLSGKKILDRSGLILDIFARRAKSREAKTQVELAQLNYLLPRLTRQWTHLSRQVGGIGTRGPGETQLEVDRRLVRKRISTLTKELQKIKHQREVRRRNREVPMKIALVGYTNAGKSTLMNALTQSSVFVENRLFATLDATVRRLTLSKKTDVLLIDTVGFIRKLPHHLVASFMSTLEEAKEADALLHVVDMSHPHLFEHLTVVKEVLSQLNILNKPTIFVFNKIDLLEHKGLLLRLQNEYAPAVFVSATKGLFLQDLKEKIAEVLSDSVVEMTVSLALNCSELISKIYELSEVLDSKYDKHGVQLKLRTSQDKSHKIARLLSAQSQNDDGMTGDEDE
ncbi:MAG: GTPase HflX [bacterium]